MSAHLIDGKAFAVGLVDKIAASVAELKSVYQVTPCPAVVLVGEDPASHRSMSAIKGERTRAAGMTSIEHRLPADTSEEALLALIDEMNNDADIDGILVLIAAA